MKEYSYIMALSNYSDRNELHLENQKKAVYSGNEELYIDDIIKPGQKPVEFNRMLEKLELNDIVKIAKLSILGPNISDIISKYKSITDKNANITIANIGMITQTPQNSEIWIDILKSTENDRLYFNRCMGHLKAKNSIIPLGKPKKYSNKQLKEALALRDRFTMKEISNMTGISKKTLERAMNKLENH